jgi:transglutaminase-like putative cysteine protease
LITLSIRHKTTYRFHEQVTLWPHRLMLRPRESRDLRLISSNVTVTPPATVTWAYDIFGNAVAAATFQGRSDRLEIDSVVELQLYAAVWPVFDIPASAIQYPFRYSDDEWIDLGALAAQQYPDAAGRLRNWARRFVRSNPTDTLALLKDLSAGVSEAIRYQSREDEGAQSPSDTLDRGWGSCRDFAVLFAEAARSLGFGTRIVSGYLYNPDHRSIGSSDAGSTHAWAEVYGLDNLRSDQSQRGWLQFDPRCGRAGHSASRSRIRQLSWNDQRLRRHVGGGSRHVMNIAGFATRVSSVMAPSKESGPCPVATFGKQPRETHMTSEEPDGAAAMACAPARPTPQDPGKCVTKVRSRESSHTGSRAPRRKNRRPVSTAPPV